MSQVGVVCLCIFLPVEHDLIDFRVLKYSNFILSGSVLYLQVWNVFQSETFLLCHKNFKSTAISQVIKMYLYYYNTVTLKQELFVTEVVTHVLNFCIHSNISDS